MKIELKEIERLAFLKYRLSGKKSMNTFIFTQAKTNKLTNTEIEKLIKAINKRIQKEKEKENQAINFTCNIF